MSFLSRVLFCRVLTIHAATTAILSSGKAVNPLANAELYNGRVVYGGEGIGLLQRVTWKHLPLVINTWNFTQATDVAWNLVRTPHDYEPLHRSR